MVRRSRGRVTTQVQDNRIRTRHLRNRRIPATRTAAVTIGSSNRSISAHTVMRRLRERGIRARRPYVSPILTRRHRQARLQWCHAQRRWLACQWNQVLFSDESRFTLEKADGRVRVYRRIGGRYLDACVTEVDRFRRGSHGLGRINHQGKTDLDVIQSNFNAQGYINDVLRPVVVPFITIRTDQ